MRYYDLVKLFKARGYKPLRFYRNYTEAWGSNKRSILIEVKDTYRKAQVNNYIKELEK